MATSDHMLECILKVAWLPKLCKCFQFEEEWTLQDWSPNSYGFHQQLQAKEIYCIN